MERKKILILADRPMHNGPRIIREIEALKHTFDIICIGHTPPKDERINFFSIKQFVDLKTKIVNAIFRRLFYYSFSTHIHEHFPKLQKFIQEQKIDVVITHEPQYMAFLSRLKKHFPIKIIFNAHEYHPLEFEDSPSWMKTSGKYFYQQYKQFINNLDILINVCDGIAQKCKHEFGKDSIVIPNVAIQSNINIHLNQYFPIKLIHHGAIMRSRKIEEMIKVAEILGSNYSLDIMGVKNEFEPEYFDEIKTLIEASKNVNLIPPVKFDEIIPAINQYDIGIFLLPPTNFNYLNALPNKLYEFIQAKLAVVVSPSPEMKKVVEYFNLGLVAEDYNPESMATKILSFTRESIEFYKLQSKKASETEHAEKYNQLYLHAVKGLYLK